MHLQAVLALERRVELADELEVQGATNGCRVDRNASERCLERLRSGHRHAVNRVVVRGAEQHHPSNLPRPGPEPGVCARGDRPGVAVPRVRSDQRLGRRPLGAGLSEMGIDLPAQCLAVAGVEHARDVRGLDPFWCPGAAYPERAHASIIGRWGTGVNAGSVHCSGGYAFK